MYYIKQCKTYGRGLYASRDIKRGEIITICELLILSPEDTKKINETDLKFYTFIYNKNQDCLVLGDGEIFNHDDEPNVEYKVVFNGQRSVMMFIATRFVNKGEQLFTDYNQDVTINVDYYKENKSLVE